MTLVHGIRANRGQFAQLMLQIMLVGFTIGMTRTVLPTMADSEFGVEKQSFLFIVSFVAVFGFVKAAMNFGAGAFSERIGRKRVLVIGWLIALPIPLVIYLAPGWGWIVAAMALLGVNQGLTWSMAQTSKLDLARPDQRGLATGLDEFAGYCGVAAAGVLTAYAAEAMGPRLGLLVFGMTVILVALAAALLWVRETLPWAEAEIASGREGHAAGRTGTARGLTGKPTLRRVMAAVTWHDRRLFAICQAGLVEKFVDALVWVFYPIFLVRNGLGLDDASWIIGIYGFVWGVSQLFTGRLSDRIGRHLPNVAGMIICGAGVAMMVLGNGMAWWGISAAVTGLGMGLLYPNLIAAVSDLSPPDWRGATLGVYRFWRDFGYGIGGIALGLAAGLGGAIDAAFWFVAVAMGLSGAVLWWLGEETLRA